MAASRVGNEHEDSLLVTLLAPGRKILEGRFIRRQFRCARAPPPAPPSLLLLLDLTTCGSRLGDEQYVCLCRAAPKQ